MALALDSLQEVIENLRSITYLIEPEDDCRTITEVHDQIDKGTAGRRSKLEKAHANLKALARVLDAARTSATRPPDVPSAERHAEHLDHLDGVRISLGKALNDAESLVTGKQAELTRLKEELRQLEESDPAAEHQLDGTPLRLRIYRDLGIQPILDDRGNLNHVLVESTSDNLHVVKFDEGTAENDLVERIWKLTLL